MFSYKKLAIASLIGIVPSWVRFFHLSELSFLISYIKFFIIFTITLIRARPYILIIAPAAATITAYYVRTAVYIATTLPATAVPINAIPAATAKPTLPIDTAPIGNTHSLRTFISSDDATLAFTVKCTAPVFLKNVYPG
jgi:hypothetical protein